MTPPPSRPNNDSLQAKGLLPERLRSSARDRHCDGVRPRCRRTGTRRRRRGGHARGKTGPGSPGGPRGRSGTQTMDTGELAGTGGLPVVRDLVPAVQLTGRGKRGDYGKRGKRGKRGGRRDYGDYGESGRLSGPVSRAIEILRALDLRDPGHAASPNEAATPAASSVPPPATTIMSISPGSAPFMNCSGRRRRLITRPSLRAGITTVVTSRDCRRRQRGAAGR